ncbi:hypothetical protein V5799_022706 [Amblyomma americanum]|uniref:Uncharacterized protein n=1 Tax=Amblyomma americanum TaxID=6943 RepID=A0AAQ4FK87_AMBAM
MKNKLSVAATVSREHVVTFFALCLAALANAGNLGGGFVGGGFGGLGAGLGGGVYGGGLGGGLGVHHGGGYRGGYGGVYGGGLGGGYYGGGGGGYYGGGYRAAYEDVRPKPFNFGYVAQGLGGSSSRQEVADGSGRVQGSYTISTAEGGQRKVKYAADAGGFRAIVDTNEPGTASESPADVAFRSSQPPASVLAAKYGPVGTRGGYGGAGYGYGGGVYGGGAGGYRGAYGVGGLGGYGLGGYGGGLGALGGGVGVYRGAGGYGKHGAGGAGWW